MIRWVPEHREPGPPQRVVGDVMSSFDVLLDDERTQLEAFVEDYRAALEATLTDLTEEQARRRLVPSATTLLGLVKHATWMQRVWFEECVGGTSRRELRAPRRARGGPPGHHPAAGAAPVG